jgi:hypothetical protein
VEEGVEHPARPEMLASLRLAGSTVPAHMMAAEIT